MFEFWPGRERHLTERARRSAFLFRHDAFSSDLLFLYLALASTGPFREEIEAVEAATDAGLSSLRQKTLLLQDLSTTS